MTHVFLQSVDLVSHTQKDICDRKDQWTDCHKNTTCNMLTAANSIKLNY